MPNFTENHCLTIPSLNGDGVTTLDISNIKEGERRLIEAKMVNPATYSELEYTFGEGYREARKHLSFLGYEIAKASKKQNDIKARLLIDEYNGFLKEKSLKDNSSIRDAFLQVNPEFVSCQDRIDMLNALVSFLEGKVKVFENVTRYMRKEMDLHIRGGVINGNKYGT
jgi:hypothetical protein